VANPYSWLNLANLLFIDNPAGVGYSINTDPTYVHNDKNTAQDTMDALVDFFAKFPEYLPNPFYISG
jgi:carboxypeptidase C (cathepsin A)